MTQKTLNYLIENELYSTYYRLPDYEHFAVDVFNTAYYICTIALADSHPHRKFGTYLLEIKKKMQHRIHGMGLALSVISLQINAHQWDRINPEMSKFGLCVFYEIEREYSDIYKTFYTPVKHNYDERKEYTTVPPDSEFMPCKITMSLLRNTCNLWDCINYFGTDIDIMLEFIFAIGKNEEEQKTIVSFLQDLTRLSFNDGAEHKYCFEHLEREIYKKYHADEEIAKVEAEIEEDLMKEYEQQWELDYYKDELQKLKAENARMQAELEQLKKHIEEVDDRHSITQEEFNAIFNPEGDNAANDNAQNKSADENLQQQLADAQKRITELERASEEEQTIYEGIDANQKVRMEIAYRLMRKAGFNPHTTKKQRAAEFMSILLDIKSDNARGNKAQTCATYISARLNDKKKNAFALEINKNTTDDVKSRAKELGIDISLDDNPA